MRGRANALLIAVAALWVAAPVAAAAADDPAAALYQPGRVDVIELNLPQASIDGLEADPDAYQPGTFSLAPTDGTPSGIGAFSAPVKAEVRLKGDASFRPLSGKAAFKLKFKKGERPFELKKMTLNNMVEDPSMTHETLAYAAFRAAGVPAPRTSFAYLRVNGEDFGLHLDIETLDDLALEKRFGPFESKTQHLYEGENGVDVSPGAAGDFEVDEGEEASRGDLEALIGAVGSSGPPSWSTRVAPFADLAEMTRMWAVEKYVGQRDGYASGESPFQPNNYYLYSDPTGKFQMIPWGTDETWQAGNHLAFGQGHGLLFTHCLADAECAAAYRESVAASCGAIGTAGLDGLASGTAALLAPWQQLEQASSRHEYSLKEIADDVAATRAFLAARPAEARAYLGGQCTSPPTPPVVAPAGSPPPAASAKPPIAALAVLRAKVAGRALRSGIALGAAGTLSQRATIATRDGTIVACRATAEVDRPQELTLDCPLSAAFLRRLRARWLRVTVVTSFASPGADPEAVTRAVVVPRRSP